MNYKFAEVSRHNLESSQNGFLKPWGRGYGFKSGFHPFFFTVYRVTAL
jgi:hypothetical protein